MNGFQKCRAERGLTQQEASSSLGVTQGAISLWETGGCQPRTELLPKIAALYNCTVDELLKDAQAAASV